MAHPLKAAFDLLRSLCYSSLKLLELFFAGCASIGLWMVQAAQGNNALWVVMLAYLPRGVEMVP
jgi:hypothetical protein